MTLGKNNVHENCAKHAYFVELFSVKLLFQKIFLVRLFHLKTFVLLDALEDVCTQLLIDHDGGKAPCPNLFDDLAAGKFKMAGQLMASSICLNGPAPNFFTSWMYKYFVGGLNYALQDIPSTLMEKSNLSKAYNYVS